MLHRKKSKTPYPPQYIPYRCQPRARSRRPAFDHHVRIARQPSNDGWGVAAEVLQREVGHGVHGVHQAGDWAQGYAAELVVDAEAGIYAAGGGVVAG